MSRGANTAPFSVNCLKKDLDGHMEVLIALAHGILDKPVFLGALCFLLVAVPVLGIIMVHQNET